MSSFKSGSWSNMGNFRERSKYTLVANWGLGSAYLDNTEGWQICLSMLVELQLVASRFERLAE